MAAKLEPQDCRGARVITLAGACSSLNRRSSSEGCGSASNRNPAPNRTRTAVWKREKDRWPGFPSVPIGTPPRTSLGQQISTLKALRGGGPIGCWFIISPPTVPDDPPGIELLGNFPNLLQAAGLVTRTPEEATTATAVLAVIQSSVKEGPGARQSPALPAAISKSRPVVITMCRYTGASCRCAAAPAARASGPGRSSRAFRRGRSRRPARRRRRH